MASEYMQTIIWNGREVVVPVPFDLNAALQAEKEQLEEQLAQAREENERLKQRVEEDRADAASLFPKLERLQKIMDKMSEENAAMRALLEEVITPQFGHGVDAAYQAGRRMLEKIRAFLAEHPKE